MDSADITATVERLAATDATACSPALVVARLADVARVESWVAARKMKLLQAADRHAASGHAAPADEVLPRQGRQSRRSGQRDAARSRTLEQVPEMADALEHGRLGVEHVDVLAGVAGGLNEADREGLFALDTELAAAAASHTPEAFRRFVKRTAEELAADREQAAEERFAGQEAAVKFDHGVDSTTGMVWVRGEFDPVTGQRVVRAIERAADRLAATAEHATTSARRRRGLALARLVDAGNASDDRDGELPGRGVLGLVLVDQQTLVDGLHEHGLCELGNGCEVPPATARRLLCDAAVLPVVLGGDGVPLDVGRARRTVTPGQRAALRAMYRTCGIPGCDGRFDRCEVHHVREWVRERGPTDLDSLVPLCSRHHHLVHEGRWRLELDPRTRRLCVRLPSGELFAEGLPDIVEERAGPPGRRAA